MTSSSSFGPGKLQVIVDGVVTKEYECESFEITPEPIREPGTTVTLTFDDYSPALTKAYNAWALANVDPCAGQVTYPHLTASPQPRRKAQWKRERNNWRKR